MRQELISNADKQCMSQIKSAERKVMEQAKRTLLIKWEEEEAAAGLKYFKDLLNVYYEIIMDIKHMHTYRTDSLLRVLEFMISFPVRNHVCNKWTAYVYERTDMLNNLTFLIFQLSTSGADEQILGVFLEYIAGTSIETVTKLFFYRINPGLIDEHRELAGDCEIALDIPESHTANEPSGKMSIDNMTPRELYYSIATGYFSINNGICKALLRLHELSGDSLEARHFLQRLRDEGFNIML